MRQTTLSLLALVAGVFAAPPAQADITIGFVTSLSGNGSSIGIPYGRGINAAYEYKKTINGETVRLIQLDDGSDPSAATRNARKLVEEQKVDLLIGTATAPSTIAMAAVASELKVPMIAVSPVGKLPESITSPGERRPARMSRREACDTGLMPADYRPTLAAASTMTS